MPTTAGLRPAMPQGCPIGALGADLRTEASTVAGSVADPALVVLGVTLDSRTVAPGELYAALPGAHAHGASFAVQAQRAGAVAVLTDDAGLAVLREAGCTLPTFVVPAPRAVLGHVAALVYGTDGAGEFANRGGRLSLLGVTGTNGKTTTTYLLDSALRAAGRTTGLIGTVETRVAGERVPSVHTTPEAPDMHRLLAVMRERGVQVCSMEVSSQALAQHRVDGIVVDVAGFTSFSQDHLELHGDMATYLAAKAMLFTPQRSREAVVVVDDDGGREIARRATVPVVTLSGRPDAAADWAVASRRHDRTGTDFVLRPAGAPADELHLRCPLLGDFNVMNTALAAVMLLRWGMSPAAVVRGLRHAGGVPGRMEQVGAAGPDAPLALVDYAHTPEAVGAALRALRPATHGRLLVVLGAGGDRDRSKRPAMGAAAAATADVVLVTDDNPRSEEPATIRAAVLAGARETAGTSGAEVLEVPDRAQAIRRAVQLAGPGDVVLVAGKGHEQGQEVAGHVHPFDDRDQLRTALAAGTAVGS